MITITQGDTATLQLSAEKGDGTAFDLTGAVFTTQIMGADGTVKSFPNSQHAILSAVAGTFTLALAAADTASLKLGGPRELVTQVVQGANTTYFHASILRVLQASPVA